MRIKEVFGLDVRFRAFLIVIPFILAGSFLVASGCALSLLYGILGVAGLFFFLRYPESPMSVLFPLLWLFWSYNLPAIGGRLERIIGALAIVGIILLLVGRRQSFPRLPRPALIGPVILIGAYALSGIINSISNPFAIIVSVSTRILFLYLAFILLSKPERLQLVANLLIITGLIGGVLILYWNLQWGIGFFRTYQGVITARASLGEFWYALLLGGNSLTIPAVLLIQKSSTSPKRLYPLLGAGFLFAMAFFAQFRREILITFALLLIYLLITNLNNLRKPAFALLLLGGVFYAFVLLPSAIFQERITETAMVSAGTDPRLISFQAGINSFIESPILGTGPASYGSTVARQISGSLPSIYYNSYNVFIYFAVETGLIGLGGFLLTLYGVFRQISVVRTDPLTIQGWIMGSATMIMIVTIVSFLFGNYYDMSLPWYLMGMILAAANSPETNPTTEPARNKLNVWHLRYNTPNKFN